MILDCLLSGAWSRSVSSLPALPHELDNKKLYALIWRDFKQTIDWDRDTDSDSDMDDN